MAKAKKKRIGALKGKSEDTKKLKLYRQKESFVFSTGVVKLVFGWLFLLNYVGWVMHKQELPSRSNRERRVSHLFCRFISACVRFNPIWYLA